MTIKTRIKVASYLELFLCAVFISSIACGPMLMRKMKSHAADFKVKTEHVSVSTKQTIPIKSANALPTKKHLRCDGH